MALSITKFEDAFDYKIVRETVCNNTAIVNVTSEPGSIYSISLKNSTSSAAYFKFFDLSSVIMGSSVATLVLRVDANTTTVYNIPDGYPFTNISFACTLNQNPVDNTALTANNNETVDVKIVCS
tara:strand:- start:2754 stop:3125 length:372 start_codon:yes stop_codon:yes gene_type:complete